MRFKKFVVIILCFLGFSCGEKKEGTADQANSSPSKTENHLLITGNGDTILTGVPIPMEGKWINPDSVTKPRKILLRGKPKVVPTLTNVHPVGTPKVVQIPDGLSVISPGQNGISMPRVEMVAGKKITAVHPKPIPAGKMQTSDFSIGNFQSLDVKQGMLSYHVTSMLEDKQGDLWFGTHLGVSRYDGTNFTHYTNEEGLSSNAGWSILEDIQGSLWFGTSGGVTRYDGITFTQFTTEEGLLHNTVRAMFEDSQGYLWIGTDGGLSRYDGTSLMHYTTKEGLVDNRIQAILEDSKGNLWLGTNNGLSCYDGTSFTNYTTKEGLTNNHVYAILEDDHGYLWIGTDEGLSRYDGTSFTHYTTKEGLSNNHVYAILEDGQGDLWFGTHLGASRYNGTSFIHYTTDEGLTNIVVRALLRDSDGNLWFGTFGGLTRYDSESFGQLSERDGLLSKPVTAIYEDRDGNLWLGGANGVSKYHGNSFSHFTLKEGLEVDFVHSILQDSQGNLWFGSNNGAICYDGLSFVYYTTAQGLGGNGVNSMLEDGQGNLWFGTSNGVSKYDGTSFTQYAVYEGSGHNWVYSLLKDHKDNIWFSNSQGLSRYDGVNMTTYTTLEGLPDNQVETMMEDGHDNLWFGTVGGGLSRYDGVDFTTYTTAEGLSHNIIRSILEDETGRIWMGTGGGITTVTNISNESDGQDFQFSTITTGLKRLDFAPESVCLDNNNQLWLGSYDGVVMFDVNQYRFPDSPPKMRLNTIELSQKYLDYGRLSDSAYAHSLSFGVAITESFDSVVPFHNYPSSMTLPHHLNHLTFEFSAIDWNAPNELRYSYLMEGMDPNWSVPSSENKAAYRNMDPGTYHFKVRSIGAAQVWSAPFEYSFTIRPPWWLTWWAYCLYGLLTIGILWSIRRYELDHHIAKAEASRLKELDSVKTKLFTNITHEFRTPLTVIQGMAHELEENPGQEAKRKTNLIKKNSKKLLVLVNQMLDLSKIQAGKVRTDLRQGDIIAFVSYLVESHESYAQLQDVGLQFFSEEHELVMDFDAKKLEQILTNLLSNAIKFTPEYGKILIVAKKILASGNSYVEIKVKDNGIGISKENLPHIFDRFHQANPIHNNQGSGIGLALVKDLLAIMNGEIRVESVLNEGSTFFLTLPIENKGPLVKESDQHTFEALPIKDVPKSKEHVLSQNGLPILLIIEDNSDVTYYLETCLNGHFQTVSEKNGKAGVETALEILPDVIISDVMMPEMDGFEVCKILKDDERSSHIPIILLTAKATKEDKLQGLTQGADAYLTKPFEKAELMIRLDKLMKVRKTLQKKYSNTLISSQTGNRLIESREDTFIEKVEKIILTNLEDVNFSINELSRELHLSRSQVHRKIKALTGMSIAIYARSVRLQKAKELLQSHELSISEVAYRCGFKSPVYFSQVFKETFGFSPSAKRK